MTDTLSFRGWLEQKDLSTRTISGYEHDIAAFFKWLEVTVGGDQVTPLDVRAYRDRLVAQSQRPATVNRVLAAIRQWGEYARHIGLLSANPAAEIRGVKVVSGGPRWLSRTEAYALLRELQRSEQLAAARARGDMEHPAIVQAYRDSAIVAMLLHAGLRVSELIGLQISDVEIGERKGHVTVRCGKGRKHRVVPLNIDARKALTMWLAVRASAACSLFHGKQDQALTARAVEHLVEKYAQRAKLEDVSPHTLRHTFAKNLTDAGVGLERVAQLMGHEDLDTTRIYVVPGMPDLERAVEQIAWSG